MSLFAFQKAMALAIRFPQRSISEIEAAVEHGLTDAERERLTQLKADPLVSKYGRKMSYLRYRDASRCLPVTQLYVGVGLLEDLFHQDFEPVRSSTDFVMVGVQFLEVLLENDACRTRLMAVAPFVPDVLRYERAKAWIERQPIRFDDPALPEGSLLRHRAFTWAELGHDVPTVDRLRRKDPTFRGAPERKELQILFLRTTTPPFYRMFQVDRSVTDFLEAQRDAPEQWTGALPPAYPSMVQVGLCRPRTGGG